jgi:cell division protein FtsW
MAVFLQKIKGDRVIWIVVIFLSVFSLLAVYSSTGTLAYKNHGGNTEFYLFKHFCILAFGLLLMYVAHRIKYTLYGRIFQVALFIAIPLLILTLIIGMNLNDAKRVLPLPFNLSFQTSDLAKLTLIMYLARLLTKKQEQIKEFRQAFVPLMLPVLIVCGLILPANFSTAAMLFVTCLVLMFIGRVNIKYILYLIGIGILALAIFIAILYAMPSDNKGRLATWKNRIENFISSEGGDNYQSRLSKTAIAEGGIFGKMPGNSTQRNFLPHPYSDFIFAIIVEEYGLLGASFLVLLYMIIFSRALKIITKIPRNFGAFLVFGVSFNLVFQAMVNMGVAVGILPVTGQPLPLVSMGGTSIWFTSISLGIILSVSKETSKDPEEIAAYAEA